MGICATSTKHGLGWHPRLGNVAEGVTRVMYIKQRGFWGGKTEMWQRMRLLKGSEGDAHKAKVLLRGQRPRCGSEDEVGEDSTIKSGG